MLTIKSNPDGQSTPEVLHESLASRLMVVADADHLARQARDAAAAAGLSQFDGTNLVQLALERTKALLELAQSLADRGDEEDLYRAIAAFWLQLRFEWQRHNDVLSYGDVNGIHSPALAAEGWVGSHLLHRLESLLLPEHIEALSVHSLHLLGAVANKRDMREQPPAEERFAVAGNFASRLGRLVGSDELLRQARQAAAEGGLSQADVGNLVQLTQERWQAIQDLVDAVGEPGDEEELYRSTVAFWVQLRLEWQRLNDVLGYGDAVAMPSPGLGAEAWVVSYLLQRLEGLLSPKHIEAMSDSVFELVNAIADDQADRLSRPAAGGLATRLMLVADAAELEQKVRDACAAIGLSQLDGRNLLETCIERSKAIQELARAVSESGDEEDLYRAIASLWLQLRFEWQRNNDVLSYGEVIGIASPTLGAEGWLGSHLLHRLETLLLPEHVEALSLHALELLAGVAHNRGLLMNSHNAGNYT
jgi:hypothetical protein